MREEALKRPYIILISPPNPYCMLILVENWNGDFYIDLTVIFHFGSYIVHSLEYLIDSVFEEMSILLKYFLLTAVLCNALCRHLF